MFFVCFIFFFFFQAEDGIRDPLVTGVQTCALPILLSVELGEDDRQHDGERRDRHFEVTLAWRGATLKRARPADRGDVRPHRPARSEERRVGKECRTRWAPEHEKKKE